MLALVYGKERNDLNDGTDGLGIFVNNLSWSQYQRVREQLVSFTRTIVSISTLLKCIWSV